MVKFLHQCEKPQNVSEPAFGQNWLMGLYGVDKISGQNVVPYVIDEILYSLITKTNYHLDSRKGLKSSEHCTKRLYQLKRYELLSIQCSELRVMGS